MPIFEVDLNWNDLSFSLLQIEADSIYDLKKIDPSELVRCAIEQANATNSSTQYDYSNCTIDAIKEIKDYPNCYYRLKDDCIERNDRKFKSLKQDYNLREIYENIAEIAFSWGYYFAQNKVYVPEGSFNLYDKIIKLAKEFEDTIWKKEKQNDPYSDRYIELIEEFINNKILNEYKKINFDDMTKFIDEGCPYCNESILEPYNLNNLGFDNTKWKCPKCKRIFEVNLDDIIVAETGKEIEYVQN